MKMSSLPLFDDYKFIQNQSLKKQPCLDAMHDASSREEQIAIFLRFQKKLNERKQENDSFLECKKKLKNYIEGIHDEIDELQTDVHFDQASSDRFQELHSFLKLPIYRQKLRPDLLQKDDNEQEKVTSTDPDERSNFKWNDARFLIGHSRRIPPKRNEEVQSLVQGDSQTISQEENEEVEMLVRNVIDVTVGGSQKIPPEENKKVASTDFDKTFQNVTDFATGGSSVYPSEFLILVDNEEGTNSTAIHSDQRLDKSQNTIASGDLGIPSPNLTCDEEEAMCPATDSTLVYSPTCEASASDTLEITTSDKAVNTEYVSIEEKSNSADKDIEIFAAINESSNLNSFGQFLHLYRLAKSSGNVDLLRTVEEARKIFVSKINLPRYNRYSRKIVDSDKNNTEIGCEEITRSPVEKNITSLYITPEYQQPVLRRKTSDEKKGIGTRKFNYKIYSSRKDDSKMHCGEPIGNDSMDVEITDKDEAEFNKWLEEELKNTEELLDKAEGYQRNALSFDNLISFNSNKSHDDDFVKKRNERKENVFSRKKKPRGISRKLPDFLDFFSAPEKDQLAAKSSGTFENERLEDLYSSDNDSDFSKHMLTANDINESDSSDVE